MNDDRDYPLESKIVTPANVPAASDGGSGVHHFKITNGSDFGDYILGKPCDGAGKGVGNTAVPIAKAAEFRRDADSGGWAGVTIDGVEYLPESNTKRIGTKLSDGETETQIPIPPYRVGAIIKAVQPISGTGISTEESPGTPAEAITWEEIVPRQWTKERELG